MIKKRLNRVKKVLVPVLATAILALIAVNVNLAQKNSAIKANVTLGSIEVLAQSEGGNGDTGGCFTEGGWEDRYQNCNGNFVLVYSRDTFRCAGSTGGGSCQEGEIVKDWDCWGNEIYCYDTTFIINC